MLTPYSITQYIREYNPEWTFCIDTNYLPDDVLLPEQHQFFRLSKNAESCSEEDFMTNIDLYPEKVWGEKLPLAAGLSIINEEKKARKNLKLPVFKQYGGIISLELNSEDGVVKQTGVHNSHYTWWRTKKFDISIVKMVKL